MAALKMSSVLFALSLLIVARSEEDSNLHFINVQPGGERHLLSRYLGPFECTFSYVAQGGTNEQWSFDLTADHDGKVYTCSIGRPSGTSYLVFSEFKVEVHGADLLDAEIYRNGGEKLTREEYDLDKDSNSVSSAPDGIESQVTRIHVLAKGVKTEL